MKLGAFLAILVAGCSMEPDPAGGQFGEEADARCEPASTTELALDEAAPHGVTPAQVLALAVGKHRSELTWTQLGQSTSVTVDIAHNNGTIAWVDYELVSGSGTMFAAACVDELEIELDVTVQTDDGALNEAFAAKLTTADVSGHIVVELGNVQGTFDPWDHAPANHDFDEMRTRLFLTTDASGVSGKIEAQGSGTDGKAAFAELVEIAAWGPAEK